MGLSSANFKKGKKKTPGLKRNKRLGSSGKKRRGKKRGRHKGR